MNGYETALALLFVFALVLVPTAMFISHVLREKRKIDRELQNLDNLRTAIRLRKEQMAKDDDTITKVERWGRELS